ncbi:uncharacterized protein TRIADDRAFT_54103 [Trichoplax adhaerens]|uniref:Ubiquitin-like protease family profile domain-containing protein n=1 Tax=Trichoplax adhaerens TaxID=10228 RepID=B3RR42_TRIAD|nr:predicted protein [Trichoplax adhaerens]EDV26811.1 predicted protein [Trichoplax adhaerens]|eukprot:XP_002110807.1 predicted protein [Trichoplax adhaerens]
MDEWLNKDDIGYLLYTKYKGLLNDSFDDILPAVDAPDNIKMNLLVERIKFSIKSKSRFIIAPIVFKTKEWVVVKSIIERAIAGPKSDIIDLSFTEPLQKDKSTCSTRMLEAIHAIIDESYLINHVKKSICKALKNSDIKGDHEEILRNSSNNGLLKDTIDHSLNSRYLISYHLLPVVEINILLPACLQIKDHNKDKRFIIVPIRFGDRHWGVLVIDQIFQTKQSVFVFSSLDEKDPNFSVVKEIVDRSFSNPKLINLVTVPCKQMSNDSTCGTLLLEAIKIIIQARQANTDENQIRTIVGDCLKKIQIKKVHSLNVHISKVSQKPDQKFLNDTTILDLLANWDQSDSYHILPVIVVNGKPFVKDNLPTRIKRKRFTISPFKLRNDHWVALVIDKNSQSSYFFDSLGQSTETQSVVKKFMTEKYRNWNTIDLSSEELKQEENATCGTWMLEAIKAMIQAISGNCEAEYMVKDSVHRFLKMANINKIHIDNLTKQRQYSDEKDKDVINDGYLGIDDLRHLLHSSLIPYKVLSAMTVKDSNLSKLIIKSMKSNDKHCIIAPIQIENNHWVALVIKQNIGAKPSVFYFDSHSTYEDNLRDIRQNIDQNGKKFDIVVLEFKRNNRCNYACGIQMMEAINCIINEVANGPTDGQIIKVNVCKSLAKKNIEEIHKNNLQIKNVKLCEGFSDKECRKPGYLVRMQFMDNKTNVKNLHAPFCWRNIPKLAVITGKNGCGKTALLDAIRQGHDTKTDKSVKQDYGIELDVSGDSGCNLPQIYAHSADSKFVGSSMRTYGDSYKASENSNDLALDLIFYNKSKKEQKPYTLKFPKYESLFDQIIKQVDDMDKFSSIENLGRDYQTIFDHELEECINGQVGLHLTSYATLDQYPKYLLENGTKLQDLNDHLNRNGFKYILSNDCLENDKFSQLMLNIESDSKNIKSEDLSPGERLELLTLLWRFETKVWKKSNVGAIILLDEPDVHLHPGLVKEMIETIKTKLISKLDIQIIMTTHSPTTVSLVPQDSIYIISEDSSRRKQVKIEKAKSKEQAIQLLTSEFVHVSLPFRLIFVEATDDEHFYQMIVNKLIQKQLFIPSIPLKFHSHGYSLKKHSPDEDGNITTEDSSRQIVERLVGFCADPKIAKENRDYSLTGFIFGLVDNDNMGKSTLNNIKCLEDRYSLENYIYDPVYLYYYFRKKDNLVEIEKEVNSKLGLKSHPVRLSKYCEDGDTKTNTRVLQIIIDIIYDKLVKTIEGFVLLNKTINFADLALKLISYRNNIKVLTGKLSENEEFAQKIEKDMKILKQKCKLNNNQSYEKDNDQNNIQNLAQGNSQGNKQGYFQGQLIHKIEIILENMNAECKDFDHKLKGLYDYADSINKAIGRLKRNSFLEDGDTLIPDRIQISFEKKIILSYPKVILKMRGHDLVMFYKETFKSMPNASNMIRFLRNENFLIPSDLVKILKELQTSHV